MKGWVSGWERLSLPVTNAVSHVMTIPIHYNESCHILFIQCAHCAEKYHGCCSDKMQFFFGICPQISALRLLSKMEFNGTKFGKGRYKVFEAK